MLSLAWVASTCLGVADDMPKVLGFSTNQTVVTKYEGRTATLALEQSVGKWTLMAVVPVSAYQNVAVYEDFSQTNGQLVFADEQGVRANFSKSLEATWAEPAQLYHGHRLEEIFQSERDLLADEILAGGHDPDYDTIAACFPPITKLYTHTFVGTRDNAEKVGIFYGGSSPNFDPAAHHPAIRKIRADGRVMEGLVGGWLPVLRFVYPETAEAWSELLVFAPNRKENSNSRVQPVWYRLSRVEAGKLAWVQYFDSYQPSPPRLQIPPPGFYADLLALRGDWERTFEGALQIDIPDRRLADLARHSLVREMITRVGAYPKYGVFDRSYGSSEHDGFQDTFTVDTTAMLDWGLTDVARQYIDNYLGRFVRDDGSILYRGPETGQYGRMLTVAAQYANYTGDSALLLRYRDRLDAIAQLLLGLRQKSFSLLADSPARGLIAGWSEADSCFDPDPARYVQPYFANSTEASRGWAEIGRVWERIGYRRHQTNLVSWGQQLQQEARLLDQDIQTAIQRSMIPQSTPPCLPAIAGVREPFHVAVVKDKLDPQFRSYRAYVEMLYSGNLTRDEVTTIINYRAAHHDVILGIPTVYGFATHEWGGFLTYGHAFGLLQQDMVREYLLTLYSLAAHHYTRGSWTASETRNLDTNLYTAPYCAPAQMTVPLLLRWMLVCEDPATNVLWLAKATPRQWLQSGQTIAVTNAPTRWGKVSYQLRSQLQSSQIEATVEPPPMPPGTQVRLRLRAPKGSTMHSVRIDSQAWTEFDAKNEFITLPPGAKGPLTLTIQY